MSSIPGGHNDGGSNEDVEADESTRTEDARASPDDSVDVGVEAGEEELELQKSHEAEGSTRGSALEPDEEGSSLAADQLLEDDVLQLHVDRAGSPDNMIADDGPATPSARSPLASPADSGSIPDDTPSLQGSLLSSPARAVSPLPRRTPPRTASGALQPFERRFEARISASPSSSPRVGSPAFLSPHSRQVSLSSQISQISSQEGSASNETPQAPWEVVRWTKLRKITGQAFSESGRRSFGRPTCLAVSALIAIGTTKGLILGFDYHQTLKIIIGQGTKATECGSVTALAIAADYSTIAAGHANGFIFTWEISKPARPFLQIPPLDRSVLQQPKHADGHLAGGAILHIGFLGTRHTALVTADAGGMAFAHLASRGLGPVTRTINTTRLLGRYPPVDPDPERNKKPSSVLAFSPLPLGNVEQATDGMGLTAMLTPYLLVIVSTTPVARTQHKSPRPKELKPHSTLSGCLAWFPAVKLKGSTTDVDRGNSDTKLVYCWSDILTVLDVKVTSNEDPAKPPSLEFTSRSRWRADEAIVAAQWLGRSVLGLLTVSQRLLIVEDGSLQVTDSIDLLHRHIYHQDLFSQQLHSVVERLDPNDPSLHGVVADAFYMSFRAYKGRTFLLGYNDLTVGTLSNWADRLVALMEAGDHIAAIRLATEYYTGGASNVSIGLPEDNEARHEMVKERLLGMISASLSYTFSQHDDAREARVRELAQVCFDACLNMQDTEFLFGDVFDTFEDADEESTFVLSLEPHILDGDVDSIPPGIVKCLVSHFISEGQGARLEELLCKLDPLAFDLDQITTLCRQHSLYDALIYVWTLGIGDFVTPLIDLLSLIKMLQEHDQGGVLDNPFHESAMKAFPYLAYSLTGRRYPGGDFMDVHEAAQVKADLYEYVFSGRTTAWPPGSKKIFGTQKDAQQEPAFPYLVMLLEFDAASFMSMLNEAFEDPFLNEGDEDTSGHGLLQTNGASTRPGYKMTRQHIVSIMLDVMRQHDFDADRVVYLDMFIARSLPKYPGQLVLSGTLLTQVFQRLCSPPSDALREDCQLSVEYLLSAHRPSDASALIRALRAAHFFRVLKYVYRTERMYTELFETYFVDPDDKVSVFDCIAYCLRPATAASPRQMEAVKESIMSHVEDLVAISVVLTAQTLASYARPLLQPAVDALEDTYTQFLFLRTLLEPSLLPRHVSRAATSPLPEAERAPFNEQYVRLMCTHDPTHVSEYVGLLPTRDLHLNKVLPTIEANGVIDAAVVLLARDGLARDAVDRLVTHLHSLQHALMSIIAAVISNPSTGSTRESTEGLVEDIQKYSKLGIWLCQGQSANSHRRPRPRTNFAWDVKEDDLDLDEYLWLNLVDAVVQVSKEATPRLHRLDERPSEAGAEALDAAKLATALRANVQQVFTALLTATATSTAGRSANQPTRAHHTHDNLSFLRVLRAFLTRAATSAPSLADLRAVLADIFSAYAFEQGILSLAHELLGSDVFVDIQQANELRQRGWRPRSQACEHCKRRAWGQGIGELIWGEWVGKEQEREAEKARKVVERVGGDEARRLERGKAKAKAAVVATPSGEAQSEVSRTLALVVFACRHVFHRACLDADYRDGRPLGGEVYRCPLCSEQA